MAKAFVVVERHYEYNDSTYDQGEYGGEPERILTSRQAADQFCFQQTCKFYKKWAIDDLVWPAEKVLECVDRTYINKEMHVVENAPDEFMVKFIEVMVKNDINPFYVKEVQVDG